MKPHRRPRWRVRAPLAATMLLVAAWVGSARVYVIVEGGGIAVSIDRGQAAAAWRLAPPDRVLTHVGLVPWQLRWGFDWNFGDGRSAPSVSLPLWLPTLAAAGATALLVRRCARGGDRLTCAACGYDRSGLAPDTSCPECGRGSEGSA